MSRLVLDHSADRALSDQLSDWLREEISSGARVPGSRLPSEQELTQEFGISRTVIRDALDDLVLEGVIVKRKGSGSFVREQPPVRRVLSDARHRAHRDSGKPVFDTEADLQGRVPSRKILAVERAPLPEDIADWLHASPGDLAVLRKRLQLLDDIPAVISTSYYPLWLAADTPLENPGALDRGPDATIEELGHRFTWGTEVFRARMPSANERRILRLDPGVSVVRMLHIDYDESNRPLQVADDLYAADQHEFAFMWSEPEGPMK